MANEQGEPRPPRKRNWRRALLFGLLGLTLGVAGTAFVLRSFEPPPLERPNLPPLPAGEVDPAVWGAQYPRHMDSYKRGLEMASTAYGGSVQEDKLKRFPWLLRTYAGYGFAEEYFEDRGHPYALEDVLNIAQVRKPAAVCLTCKTAQFPKLLEKYGIAYYSKTFDEVAAEVKHPIACADCHNPETMALQISRPALVDAFKRQGKDITTATRQEMRTLVCAQCHVEYYFKPENKEVTFPWDKGMEVANIEAYYDEIKFKDWTHPDSGANMIKIQHPDYEFYMGSTHQTSNVSCADCHMPFVREGNTKITSHWWTSPLKHVEQSCTVCHRQGVDYLTERVRNTQQGVYGQLNVAGQAMATAIETIKAAAAVPTVDAKLLDQARALHRKAQIRLDWMSSENSMGFHNSQEAMRVLGEAIDLAYQTRLTALAATGAIPAPVPMTPPEVPKPAPSATPGATKP